VPPPASTISGQGASCPEALGPETLVEKQKTTDTELDKQVDDLRQAERKNRLKWSLIAGVLVTVSVVLVVAFVEYREFFFRPKPDMNEVERVAFNKTNDPACRALIDNIDKQEVQWKASRLELQKVDESMDVAAVEAAQKQVRDMLAVYGLEERRLETIAVRDSNVRGDISKYIRHVLHYLKKMEQALDARIVELKSPPAPESDAGAADGDAGVKTLQVPGLGEVAVTKADAGAAEKGTTKPVVDYQRAWSMVTEDHDKWRVFRQGPIPCGRREGAVPRIPAKARDLSDPRTTDGTVKLAPKP
jgi:hypothetical protein